MHVDERSTHDVPDDTTRARHAILAADYAAGINLQERERVRIGFDLHDGPAQTMSAALLQVRMLDDLDGDDLKSGLRDLRSTLSLALEEIYELIESLGGRGSGGVIAAPPLLGYLLVYLKNPLCVASIVLAMVCAWLASSIVTQRRQRRLSGA